MTWNCLPCSTWSLMSSMAIQIHMAGTICTSGQPPVGEEELHALEEHEEGADDQGQRGEPAPALAQLEHRLLHGLVVAAPDGVDRAGRSGAPTRARRVGEPAADGTGGYRAARSRPVRSDPRGPPSLVAPHRRPATPPLSRGHGRRAHPTASLWRRVRRDGQGCRTDRGSGRDAAAGRRRGRRWS